jgi:hypothetical protein
VRAFAHGEDIGSFYLGADLVTLIHEAVHQRLNSGNEALVECTAMKLLPSVLTELFHIPTTVSQQYVAKVVKTVKHKKQVRYVILTRQVPSLFYNRILADALRWHNLLPPQYLNGSC